MIDEICGKDIGIFKVLYLCNERTKDGHKKYHIKCNFCGAEFERRLSSIKGTKICRHYNEQGYFRNFKTNWNWENKKIKTIFYGMKNRCYNPKNKSYRFYGAKNIKICEEWLLNPKSFEQWALQNGYSENLTIDRIDAKKDYAPDNCQWIPLEENARKAGKVNWITINGETLTGRQWSEKLGLGINRINTWIREYGEDITIELLKEMIKDPPINKYREPSQSWFEVYGIF